MKNTLILLSVCAMLSCNFVSVQASEKDVFEVMRVYVENNVLKDVIEDIEVLDEGVSIEDAIYSKVDFNYKGGQGNSGSSSNSSGNSSGNAAPKPDKYPNQDKYFAGTTDYTDIKTAIRDTDVNGWSAIRDAYSKYDDRGSDNVTIIATAYTSAAEENGGWAGMNAIGGKLGPGCIAAPKDIPFQTKIRISGLGVFNVEDRGSAIVRVADDVIRIDVWMDSYKEAMKFGKRVYKGRIM